jgi:hypothetical protein
MKQPIKITLILFAFFVTTNFIFSQLNIAEKDLIGNWVITDGSGKEFDKEMVGTVITFDKDHKAKKIEEGEKIEAEWKFENNIITISYFYNDGKNAPDIETLTITGFNGKKLTTNYADDDDTQFIIIFERTNQP